MLAETAAAAVPAVEVNRPRKRLTSVGLLATREVVPDEMVQRAAERISQAESGVERRDTTAALNLLERRPANPVDPVERDALLSADTAEARPERPGVDDELLNGSAGHQWNTRWFA